MKKEMRDQLRSKFPAVFGATEFNVGDGWYSLLEEAGAKFANFGVTVYEARSKLATLRFYTSVAKDTPKEVRNQALDLGIEMSRKSSFVCEDCGEPGATQNISGAFFVTCSECYLVAQRRYR